jgi:hypothetical protein
MRHMKYNSKTFSEITEEDKKILEIFKIIDKNKNIIHSPNEDVNNNEFSMSIASQSEAKAIPPIKVTKKRKRPIFRILRDSRSSKLVQTRKFITELEHLISFNNKIMLELLEEEKIENNFKNISEFMFYNMKYNPYSFLEKEVKAFEDVMNFSLNIWRGEKTSDN